ncbi:uncharacterized protein LOC132842607 [Tachysurus vachellii]|uniref:uncharacterized protein LOC132842607 n=1 Tax=Tachysurus vachellii TaxID=175792 RepID=UPI00296AC0A2|nr:uncharacterized protein LOC132842607 [Tachysurus vachellii]XP_060721350.1 uncharacterized protein LOC132842607 [Tachysurus vachellii]XP_060721351.1 uncharacterized protein LOC132842607 [Tachysurus vachellii]
MSAMSQNITKFCDEIKFGNKFNYTSGHSYSTDCEPTWYAQNGTSIGDEMSLVLDTCLLLVQLVIRCLRSQNKYEYVFQVTNRITSIGVTESTKTDDHSNNYLWLLFLLVLLVPLVALIALIVYLVRRKRKQNYSLKRDVENAAKEEVQALNEDANGSPKRDGGNEDDPNGNAVTIPMNSIKPQNEEEDEAPHSHALVNGHVHMTHG